MLFLTQLIFGQSTTEEKIDSLKEIISGNENYASVLNAYFEWDNLIYASDPDLDLQLNLLIDSLAPTFLAKTTNETDQKSILVTHSSALNNLGILSTRYGKVSESIDYFEKSLLLKKQIADSKGIGSVYNNLANLFMTQEDIPRAKFNYLKSLEVQLSIDNEYGVAAVYNNLGSVFAHEKNLDSAIYYFQSSIAINEKIGNIAGVANDYINLGGIYGEELEFQKALDLYDKSLVIFNEINHEKGQAAAFNAKSNIYHRMGRDTDAIKWANKALIVAKKYNSLDLLESSTRILYLAYKSQQDYGPALSMFENNKKYNDSINNIENQKAIISQEYERAYLEKTTADSIRGLEAAKVSEAKLTAKTAENDKRKQQSYFLYGFILIACIFTFILYNRFRFVRKQKSVIQAQKKTVDQAFSELSYKNQQVTDSINYAKRIQTAMLPADELIEEILPNSFIFYQPKDIVAGDFYWVDQTKDMKLFAVGDCTGHGVPGAMVSVLCANSLNRTINDFGLTDPGKILNKSREIVISEFEKSGKDISDGMDIAICALSGNKLQFAGANNPLYVLKKGSKEVIEIKGDRQPVSKFDRELPFTTHTVSLEKGDMIYVFSDGFSDQFGGPKYKKYKSLNFKNFIEKIGSLAVDQQKLALEKEFLKWKGEYEQVDDICIMGIRF